jgi:hypothetical protein
MKEFIQEYGLSLVYAVLGIVFIAIFWQMINEFSI